MKKWLLWLVLLLLPWTMGWAEETYTIDPEMGIWQYESDVCKVEIHRHEDTDKKLIWYECELFCSPESPLLPVQTNPKRPGTGFKYPEWIACTNKLVFAINDDYFGDRVYNDETAGVVIRGGNIIRKKTYKNGSKALPNLETLALYPDGSMTVHQSKELTAEEYLERGATDVFAFGPILIRDGVINEKLTGRYANKEPRMALGMVEPYHYVCVAVEGRHSKSKGTGLQWVAEKLQAMGAVQALNLDGGQTTALVFMGEKINKNGKFGARANQRTLTSMIGVGVSNLVPEYGKR